MTRYEKLQDKADKLQSAIGRTNGFMRSVWEAHLYKLRKKIDGMTIEEAMREV